MNSRMPNEKALPKEEGVDHTLSLLKEGYLFLANRRNTLNSKVFETRVLGKKAICLSGKEAAELFYDNKKFIRHGVVPERVIQTLFGKGGVQGLDGEEHTHRKKMFMSVMTKERLQQLADITGQQFAMAVDKWRSQEQVVLFEEMQLLLTKVACEWAGVPLSKDQIQKLSKDLTSLFETPAAVGPRNWGGRMSRNRIEKSLIELVEAIREEKVTVSADSILSIFATHRDLDNHLLDKHVVAVEILNILRPIVAVSIFVNFLALALHNYPEDRKKLETGDPAYAQMFIQEVRRFYPFFPFTGATTKESFTWKGYDFEEGTLTLLDLYGTNHDPDEWENPDKFLPERFKDWKESPFSFIPQGGGDFVMGHRCAGEWATVEILKVCLDYLVNKLTYTMPPQDLSYSMSDIPSIPKSKIILTNVEPKKG